MPYKSGPGSIQSWILLPGADHRIDADPLARCPGLQTYPLGLAGGGKQRCFEPPPGLGSCRRPTLSKRYLASRCPASDWAVGPNALVRGDSSPGLTHFNQQPSPLPAHFALFFSQILPLSVWNYYLVTSLLHCLFSDGKSHSSKSVIMLMTSVSGIVAGTLEKLRTYLLNMCLAPVFLKVFPWHSNTFHLPLQTCPALLSHSACAPQATAWAIQ